MSTLTRSTLSHSQSSTTPPYQPTGNRSLGYYLLLFLTLNLRLRRSLPWLFIIADVKKSILGPNFLRHFGLMVDMNNCKLVDTSTHLYIQGILSSDTPLRPSVCLKDTTNCYSYLTLLSTMHTHIKKRNIFCFEMVPYITRLIIYFHTVVIKLIANKSLLYNSINSQNKGTVIHAEPLVDRLF